MNSLKTEIISFVSGSFIRELIKKTIVLFDKLTRSLNGENYDVLILADFKNNGIELVDSFADYNVKYIQFSLKTIIPAIFYVRRSKLIYVDNMNIVIAALVDIESPVIQIWHATSAVKKFGLASSTNSHLKDVRTAEFKHYDYVVSNSLFMDQVYEQSFGFEQKQLLKLGSLQSLTLFEESDEKKLDQKYILYVPTFRWLKQDTEEIINFIESYRSDKYILLYALHPKMKAKITNPKARRINNGDVRSYFRGASMVISDYSSLLIDASLVCNSVAMYAPDYLHYRATPGLNVDKDNFWGYFTTTMIELYPYIDSDNFIQHNKQAIKELFFTFDDANSISRIADHGKTLIN